MEVTFDLLYTFDRSKKTLAGTYL